jgi:DNA-binding transcriptional MerR regulator
MTTAEAARRLGTHPGNIRGYITAGRLPAKRVDTPRGAVWDIDESDLLVLHRRKYARGTQKRNSQPVLHVSSTRMAGNDSPEDRSYNAGRLYALPDRLLKRYHSLLDKRFDTGLSQSEEKELMVLSVQLGEADMMTPLEQRNSVAAASEHERRMAILDRVMELLTTF